MPAAKLVLDFDTRKFTDAVGSLVLSFTGKKDSIREYELLIQQNNVTMSLPSGATVKAAMKKVTDPPGTILVEADATRAGWGTGSRWFFTLDLTDVAFNTVLGTNVDFEILIELADGQRIPSLTFPFKIEKQILTP
jgi:hypothetical protein